MTKVPLVYCWPWHEPLTTSQLHLQCLIEVDNINDRITIILIIILTNHGVGTQFKYLHQGHVSDGFVYTSILFSILKMQHRQPSHMIICPTGDANRMMNTSAKINVNAAPARRKLICFCVLVLKRRSWDVSGKLKSAKPSPQPDMNPDIWA